MTTANPLTYLSALPRSKRLSNRRSFFRPDPAVKSARQYRGGLVDWRHDRCRTCVHFQPPDYCPEIKERMAPDGCCALHRRET